jgi:hypothetical protein
MDDDRGRITRTSGALGREDRREERFLEEVRREIRREVATVIREEVARAVGGHDSWERLERLLVQRAEEEKTWRTAVDRRLEALEQAFRVGPASPGESAQAVERSYKRARVPVDGEGTTNEGSANDGRVDKGSANDGRVDKGSANDGRVDKGSANDGRVDTTVSQHQGEGLAQSQHAPRGGEMPTQLRRAPKQSDTPIPGLGAVRMPKPTYANIASRPASNAPTAPRRPSDGDGFMTVGKNGRARKESQAAASGPGDFALKPITRGNTEDDRKVIFPRDGLTPHPLGNEMAIPSEVNRALHKAGVPAHVRLAKLRRNENGVLTGLVEDKTNARQFLQYAELVLMAARKADPGVIEVASNETWARLKIHGVPLHRYMGDDPAEGLQLLREELEAENPGVQVPTAGWLVAPRWIKERWQREEIKSSSVVLAVKDRAVADRLRTKGLKAAGVYYTVERYIAEGPDVICTRCCAWGHIEEKCKHPTPRCMWCAGNHRSSDHRCLVTVCSAKPGDRCRHTTEKCCNCGGSHNARSKHCPQKIEAIRRAKALRSGGDKQTRDEPVRSGKLADLASPQQSNTPGPTGIQESTKVDTQMDDTPGPGLLLLEAANMDDDEDGTSSLSSLPNDMEVDETEH